MLKESIGGLALIGIAGETAMANSTPNPSNKISSFAVELKKDFMKMVEDRGHPEISGVHYREDGEIRYSTSNENIT